MIFFRSRAFLLPAILFGAELVIATSVPAQDSASLHGRATDATGQPVPNAVVQLVSDQTTHGGRTWRYTLIGDSLGKFSQEGLAPGAYLVMLFTDGKPTDILRSVQLKSGAERSIDLTLKRPMQVAGTSLTDERRRISGQTR